MVTALPPTYGAAPISAERALLCVGRAQKKGKLLDESYGALNAYGGPSGISGFEGSFGILPIKHVTQHQALTSSFA